MAIRLLWFLGFHLCNSLPLLFLLSKAQIQHEHITNPWGFQIKLINKDCRAVIFLSLLLNNNCNLRLTRLCIFQISEAVLAKRRLHKSKQFLWIVSECPNMRPANNLADNYNLAKLYPKKGQKGKKEKRKKPTSKNIKNIKLPRMTSLSAT